MFFKIVLLKNFAIFTGHAYEYCSIHRKTPGLESLFNKVPSLQARNFIKKRLQHRSFSMNIAIFTGKHLGWSLFLIKLEAFGSVTLIKRGSNTGVFL